MGDELHEAFRELVDKVAEIEHRLEHTRPALDERERVEGYKWIFAMLQVALDVYVWADTGRPRFVDIVGPVQEVGRRQRRRLLPVRADRPAPARTGSAGAAATPCTCRSPCTAGPSDGHY